MSGARGLLKLGDPKIVNDTTAIFCFILNITVNFYSAKRFLIAPNFREGSLRTVRCLAAFLSFTSSGTFLFVCLFCFSDPMCLSLFMKWCVHLSTCFSFRGN